MMKIIFAFILAILFTADTDWLIASDFPSAGRFIVNGDCVADNHTGLIWARSPNNIPMTWYKAQAYIKGLNLCGYKDWRLPNLKEFKNMINISYKKQWCSEKSSCPRNAGLLNTSGFINIQAIYYWTSDELGDDKANAWNMDLWDGNTIADNKDNLYYLWLVRGKEKGVENEARAK